LRLGRLLIGRLCRLLIGRLCRLRRRLTDRERHAHQAH
jgi:hypothetical protein